MTIRGVSLAYESLRSPQKLHPDFLILENRTEVTLLRSIVLVVVLLVVGTSSSSTTTTSSTTNKKDTNS